MQHGQTSPALSWLWFWRCRWAWWHFPKCFSSSKWFSSITLLVSIYSYFFIFLLPLSGVKKFGGRLCHAPNMHQTSIGGAQDIVHHRASPSFGCALIILQTSVVCFAIYLVTKIVHQNFKFFQPWLSMKVFESSTFFKSRRFFLSTDSWVSFSWYINSIQFFCVNLGKL